MKLSPAYLVVLAAAAGAAVYALKTTENDLALGLPRHLVPGGKYQIVARAVGPEGTNWQGVYDELTGMGVKDVEITGNGDDRKLTYTSTPTKTVKMQEGKPLFQITGFDVNVTLVEVVPLGRA
jgi:hypothetical protein